MAGGSAAGAVMSINPASAVRATVKVLDQHGKVVHDTSKTFFSAFREAKDAYRLRKAEIAAERVAERRARETLRRRHTTSSRAIEDAPPSKHRKKPHRNDSSSIRNSASSAGSSGSSSDGHVSEDELIVARPRLRSAGSSETLMHREEHGLDNVPSDVLDMAPAIFNDPSVRAVSEVLAHVQSLIDELACWTAGITTLISELQKRPDMIAAVGLSLAEISQMITKIAPVALPLLKGSFPTIFALISSPHFAVVAGIGAAATVVVLGGYKIVKNVMAGAQENFDLAYGEDVHDDDDDDQRRPHGEILGEVMEDHLIMPASAQRTPQHRQLENGPPPSLDRRNTVAATPTRRGSMAPPDFGPTTERKQSMPMPGSERRGSLAPPAFETPRPKNDRKGSSTVSSNSVDSERKKKHDKRDKEEREMKKIESETRRLEKEERRREKEGKKEGKERKEGKEHKEHKERKASRAPSPVKRDPSFSTPAPMERKSSIFSSEKKGSAQLERRGSTMSTPKLERRGSSMGESLEKKEKPKGLMKITKLFEGRSG